MRVPEGAERDFVAGAFIVKEGRVLLLNHKKYGFWLQPGGHVEDGETPDEAAVRETKEETGLEVEIIDRFRPEDNFQGDEAENLPRPVNVNVHRVGEGHWHVDFLYVARIIDEGEFSEYDENEMKWFSKKDLEQDDLEIPGHVRKVAIRVLDSV